MERTKKEFEGKAKIDKDKPKLYAKAVKCNFAHIKFSHEDHQVFKCDKREKCFPLHWRLTKHMTLHAYRDKCKTLSLFQQR